VKDDLAFMKELRSNGLSRTKTVEPSGSVMTDLDSALDDLVDRMLYSDKEEPHE
jgi:hypothetical protein